MTGKLLSSVALAALAVLALTGCEGVRWGATSLAAHELNIFQNPDVNLTAKNYAAADYIIQQAQTFIDKDRDIITAQPLINFEDPQTPAQIGALFSEQIGARLTQLGYNVDLSAVSMQKDNLNMSDIVGSTSNIKGAPDFTLSGYYREYRPNMQVSLRLIEIATGRVVGSFDYTMPTNREIREFSKPKPQIIRTTPAPAAQSNQ